MAFLKFLKISKGPARSMQDRGALAYMYVRLFLCLILINPFFIPSKLFARESIVTSECELKTAYIYQFTKYVNWAKLKGDKKELIIGVIANEDMVQALSRLNGRVSQGMKIVVRSVEKGTELSDIDILYLEKGYLTDDDVILKAVKNHILTISDEEDATHKGVIIGLFRSDSRLRFNINLKIADQSSLRLSSRLLSLANSLVK